MVKPKQQKKRSTLRRKKDDPGERTRQRKKLANVIISYIKNRQLDALEKQARKETNFNIYGDGHQPPLLCAVKLCVAPACALLLDNGALINIRNRQKQTPLHLFCRLNPKTDGWEDIKQYFEEFNSPEKGLTRLKINPTDKKGRTPLHEACIYNNLEAVKFLRSLGVILDPKDHDGKLPIELTTDIILINNLVAAGVIVPNSVHEVVSKWRGDKLIELKANVDSLCQTYKSDTKPHREFMQLIEIHKPPKEEEQKRYIEEHKEAFLGAQRSPD